MKPTALSRYLIEAQHQGHINADLRLLLEVVARACKRCCPDDGFDIYNGRSMAIPRIH